MGPQQLNVSRPWAAAHDTNGDGAHRGLPTRRAALVPQRLAEEPSRTLVDRLASLAPAPFAALAAPAALAALAAQGGCGELGELGAKPLGEAARL